MDRGSFKTTVTQYLVASGVEYHKQCKANFFACKDIPGQKNVAKTPGRPASEPMKQKFQLCDWLDNQAKLFTIKDLHEKLCSISKNGEDIYSLKRMKQKLEDHNGETFFLQISQDPQIQFV